MKLRRSAVLGVVLLAIAGVGWLLRPPVLAPVSGEPDVAVERRASYGGTDAVTDRREAIVEALRSSRPDAPDELEAKSLRGTDLDGALPVDANGHLAVSPSVRQFFDYFFVTSGEIPLSEIRASIIAAIEARLDEPARREAIELLARYIEYRDSGRQLMEEGDAAADLDDRLEQIRQLRRASLGEEVANAMFADEEARDYVAVAERQIAANPSISEEERTARLEALEAQLPESERAARAASTAPLRLVQDEAILRSVGASPEEIRALREQRFGLEAADRLADLDRRRAEWQQRVEDYRREREAIEADESLEAEDRARAVSALLVNHFSETEQLRVRALDKIRAEADGSFP